MFFFFKQKTAYEMRISDWSSDVCSSDLGADPYSASKGCTEIVANSFRRSYFSAPGAPLLATARAGNVFGGGDWAVDRLVPDIVRAIMAGTPVDIRHPGSVRDRKSTRLNSSH